MTEIDNIIDLAKELVTQVENDDTGGVVGQFFRGGNGGLLSNDTIRAADRLRAALHRLEGHRPDDPDVDAALRKRAAAQQL